MASFEAKIWWKRSRKRGNKNYRSVPFLSYPKRNRKFQKRMARKLKNLKKKPFWLHFKPKQVGQGWKREKIKIIVSFRFVLTRRIRYN